MAGIAVSLDGEYERVSHLSKELKGIKAESGEGVADRTLGITGLGDSSHH